MAYRTRTELFQDFADNATGNIVAQNHRDFVESVMVYGTLSVDNDSLAVSTTPVKIPFDTSLFAYGMTADTTNNEFDNVELGHYRMTVDFDVTLSGQNTLYTFQLYADGAPVGDGFTWNTSDSSRLTKSFVRPANLSADAGTLDIRVSTTGSQTMTIGNIDWILERMGSA